jgi:hypothetical protein
VCIRGNQKHDRRGRENQSETKVGVWKGSQSGIRRSRGNLITFNRVGKHIFYFLPLGGANVLWWGKREPVRNKEREEIGMGANQK